MATLTTNVVPHTGLINVVPVAAESGGDQCATGSGVLLYVNNGDASAHTVTLVTPTKVDGLDVADRAVAVPAGQTAYIPVTDLYRDPSTGLASITYAATPTSVTVAVLRVS